MTTVARPIRSRRLALLALADLVGWRRWLLAFALGALLTTALPPVHLLPAAIPALVGLLLLCRGVSLRRGLITGWWFGFGHHTAGLYWIANALLVEVERFWWLLPAALFGLPAVLAVFTALAVAVGARRTDASQPLLFTVAWTVAELARGTLFTGFPWNLLAYGWVDPWGLFTAPMQMAAVLGAYGLTLVTVLAASLPVLAVTLERRRWIGPMAALGLVAALFAGGAVRLTEALSLHAWEAMVPGVWLRLVQPAIPQSLKWDQAARVANFRKHLELSAQPAGIAPTAILWAETATPFFLEHAADARAALGALNLEAVWLIGTPRLEVTPEGPRYGNGMVVLDASAQSVLGTYDKAHLVPFGEYVPLRRWLPIERIAGGTGGEFTPGPGPRSLRIAGLPAVGPLICYEVIFPGAVVDRRDRPDWLLNLTNDAWYGYSAGPFQHWAISRLRAIEEGLPLVRVANTGISGIIDPFGRVVASLSLEQEGVVDGPLPRAIPVGTLYSRLNQLPVSGLVVGLFLVSVLLHRRKVHV